MVSEEVIVDDNINYEVKEKLIIDRLRELGIKLWIEDGEVIYIEQ